MSAKVPLSELANLFNHLPSNSKAQLQSAFQDAEDMLNFNNTSNTGAQSRRKQTTSVGIPILTSTTNSRGFDVSWDRLDDKRISFYQVQVSFDSIFSNPDSYNVVDTSIALEGIGTTVYVRVRGVRFDGLCGSWSDTETIDAFATTAGPVVYSRGFDDAFYLTGPFVSTEVQHISITPQRENGGIVVFGSIGLKDVVGPSPGDTILVRLNGTVLDNIDLNTTPYTSSLIEDFSGDPNFSIAFGPVFLAHEDFSSDNQDNLHPAVEVSSGSGSGTFSGWNFSGTGALGTPDTVFPSTDFAAYDQTCTARGETRKSKYLHLTNIGATIPAGNTITGIEVTMYGDVDPTHIDLSKLNAKIIEFGLVDQVGVRRPSITTGVAWPNVNTASTGDPIPNITFGGNSDLFGEAAGFWTPTKVNDVDFGIYMRAQLHISSSDLIAQSWFDIGQTADANFKCFGISVTINSVGADNTARVDVILTADAELVNCNINAIEFGDAI